MNLECLPVDLVVAPIRVVCDDVHVLYDLNVQARRVAEQAAMNVARVATVKDRAAFSRMLAHVVRQRIAEPLARVCA